MAPENQDALIQQFCLFTAADPSVAESTLAAHDWNVDAAIATFLTIQDGEEDHGGNQSLLPRPQVPAGGRTLGGEGTESRYVPPTPGSGPSASGGGRGSAAPARGVAGARTLRDLQGDAHAGHGHAHDDDDDDGENQDMFAGGEKSGLAVQNPNGPRGPRNPRDEIEDMLNRARQDRPPPDRDDDEQPRSHFTGRGITLGGDGTESRVIEDPRAASDAAPRRRPRVQRVLHLWADGFSVDDGDLFRYDDPANADTLAMINSGRAPLGLLNVEPNQEVDLQLDNQKETKFVQPKKKYKPFSGSGQRLGSPTPGIGSSAPAPAAPVLQPTNQASASTGASVTPSVDVNESQPMVTLQIRMGDGTQMRARFNTTHAIGDVYSFVDRALPAQRSYVLMTTFPSKPLEDRTAALGDIAELNRGGVVVQKWT